MREIITLHVGGCGNRIGESLWEQLISQHGLAPDGTTQETAEPGSNSIQTYFSELSDRHVPRALLVDLDCDSVDRIRARRLGKLFSEDNSATTKLSGASTFASGYYRSCSSELCGIAMEALRRETEKCDSVQCLQVTHSTTGGSGSGLQARLMGDYSCEYPSLLTQGISIAPSSNVSNGTLDVYNFLLGFHHMIEKHTFTNLIQNQCLTRICCKRQSNFKPTLGDMNSIVAKVATSSTLSLRFPGSLNTSIRKICTNLIPFPRLHFFTAGIAPLGPVPSKDFTAETLLKSAYSTESLLTQVDWREGRFFATANIFSGNGLTNSEVEQALFAYKEQNSSFYTEWIPDGIHASLARQPSNHQPSLISLMNTSSIRVFLMRLAEQFTVMFRTKAFLHHFTVEGMDEMEFTEAESNLNDLTCQFPEAMYNMGDYDEDGIYDDPPFFGDVE